jgi:metal-dependent amidase/aminoacylase/carboxypeptidase family protein
VAHYYVRSDTLKNLNLLKARCIKCFEAAAMATGCTVDIVEVGSAMLNILTNDSLAESFSDYFQQMSGVTLPSKTEQEHSNLLGSTDMGNVSYVLPAAHPCYSVFLRPPYARSRPVMFVSIQITTGPSNHTRDFAAAAGELAID